MMMSVVLGVEIMKIEIGGVMRWADGIGIKICAEGRHSRALRMIRGFVRYVLVEGIVGFVLEIGRE